MSDEERFEAGQVLYLERLLNGKWFRKGHVRLEDYIAERLEESRQYREQWLRAVEQERQKVRAEFEEWKKNHLNHEADDLRAKVERLNKGLRDIRDQLYEAECDCPPEWPRCSYCKTRLRIQVLLRKDEP